MPANPAINKGIAYNIIFCQISLSILSDACFSSGINNTIVAALAIKLEMKIYPTPMLGL
jgi:hypothetical protein